MNISDITTKRLGGFPQVGAAVAEIGQRPTKPCEHDFVFLRAEDFINPDGVQNLGKHRGFKDVFYCRRCLEYREVKR